MAWRVLYCVVLCCAVLCCAVLCCAVLCCAVLCCAVLYYCMQVPQGVRVNNNQLAIAHGLLHQFRPCTRRGWAQATQEDEHVTRIGADSCHDSPVPRTQRPL
jgi:hypothetical protein